jgi:predicted ATPase
VLGREFTYELIERLATRPKSDLNSALAQLTEAGLLVCRGVPPEAVYLFKHALVQDAAYSTLLRGKRQELPGSRRCWSSIFPISWSADPNYWRIT